MKKILSLLLILVVTLTACNSDVVEQYESLQNKIIDGDSFTFEMTSDDGYNKYAYNDEGRILVITDFMDEGFSTYIIDGIAYTCNDNEKICIAVSEDHSTNEDIVNIIKPYIIDLNDIDYTTEDSTITSENYEYNVSSNQIDFNVNMGDNSSEGYIKLDNEKIELPYEVTNQY